MAILWYIYITKLNVFLLGLFAFFWWQMCLYLWSIQALLTNWAPGVCGQLPLLCKVALVVSGGLASVCRMALWEWDKALTKTLGTLGGTHSSKEMLCGGMESPEYKNTTSKSMATFPGMNNHLRIVDNHLSPQTPLGYMWRNWEIIFLHVRCLHSAVVLGFPQAWYSCPGKTTLSRASCLSSKGQSHLGPRTILARAEQSFSLFPLCPTVAKYQLHLSSAGLHSPALPATQWENPLYVKHGEEKDSWVPLGIDGVWA